MFRVKCEQPVVQKLVKENEKERKYVLRFIFFLSIFAVSWVPSNLRRF